MPVINESYGTHNTTAQLTWNGCHPRLLGAGQAATMGKVGFIGCRGLFVVAQFPDPWAPPLPGIGICSQFPASARAMPVSLPAPTKRRLFNPAKHSTVAGCWMSKLPAPSFAVGRKMEHRYFAHHYRNTAAASGLSLPPPARQLMCTHSPPLPRIQRPPGAPPRKRSRPIPCLIHHRHSAHTAWHPQG